MCAGRIHGVFIDETGSPGLINTPTHLHSKRKSWVAVVVPRNVIAEVWDQFPHAINALKKLTGASEFHFADIYGGRKQFKNVPEKTRLGIFEFMAHIFQEYNFPAFVQTFDPDSLCRVRDSGLFPERIGKLFDLKNHDHLAFLFLLIRVKWHLESNYAEAERLTRVFVDEGFKKNGLAFFLKPFENVFADGLICFGKSDVILPIQLADCAAFCLNRMQLLLGLPQLSDFDLLFLRIIQPIALSFQNIPSVPVDTWVTKDDSRLQ
jgi:hypothetical protein